MINTPKKGSHTFAKSDSFDEADVSEEVARILFINENYSIKTEKFKAIVEICFHNLGIERGSPYFSSMRHYFFNAANYIMRADNFVGANQEEIDEYRKYNQLFMSVVKSINNLDTDQKKHFLASIKHHHDTDQTVPTPNPITVMNTILSSILSEA